MAHAPAADTGPERSNGLVTLAIALGGLGLLSGVAALFVALRRTPSPARATAADDRAHTSA
ncbi:MAG: hypothetical protein GEU74_04530 [Nitriliruptorales bacterium]|nr:hypothetical protein [Nitriliruptorales bacterium]